MIAAHDDPYLVDPPSETGCLKAIQLRAQLDGNNRFIKSQCPACVGQFKAHFRSECVTAVGNLSNTGDVLEAVDEGLCCVAADLWISVG